MKAKLTILTAMFICGCSDSEKLEELKERAVANLQKVRKAETVTIKKFELEDIAIPVPINWTIERHPRDYGTSFSLAENNGSVYCDIVKVQLTDEIQSSFIQSIKTEPEAVASWALRAYDSNAEVFKILNGNEASILASAKAHSYKEKHILAIIGHRTVKPNYTDENGQPIKPFLEGINISLVSSKKIQLQIACRIGRAQSYEEMEKNVLGTKEILLEVAKGIDRAS